MPHSGPVTGTFGMSVLEAKSLGLPTLVLQHEGPQELIINGQTGYALRTESPELRIDACRKLMATRTSNPMASRAWREEIKTAFEGRYSWQHLVDEITEKPGTSISQLRAFARYETSPLAAV